MFGSQTQTLTREKEKTKDEKESDANKIIKKTKEENVFHETKDAFDEGTIPPQLDFFYGGEHLSDNFKHACIFLSLNYENIGFVDFLCSDRGQNIMTNDSLYMLNPETFFTRISTRIKIFILYFWLNKAKQNQ